LNQVKALLEEEVLAVTEEEEYREQVVGRVGCTLLHTRFVALVEADFVAIGL
jgi:hypothetical protein